MTELGSTLCTSCGLCCAGALFTRAVLRPEEVQWARTKRSLHVIERDDGPSFTLPCHLLHDRKCSVYQERPQVCGAFKCKLLRRLEDGELGLEDALVKVRRLDALFTRARAHGTPTTVEAMLDLGELEALAERDFRDPPASTPTPPTTT
jgi:uncharacterized protein